MHAHVHTYTHSHPGRGNSANLLAILYTLTHAHDSFEDSLLKSILRMFL